MRISSRPAATFTATRSRRAWWRSRGSGRGRVRRPTLGSCERPRGCIPGRSWRCSARTMRATGIGSFSAGDGRGDAGGLRRGCAMGSDPQGLTPSHSTVAVQPCIAKRAGACNQGANGACPESRLGVRERAMSQSEQLLEEGRIFLGMSKAGAECLELKLANRHGLVTGATGTGKTVSLQVLAEGFSAAGVPVFAADIKGDLSGISAIGQPKEGLAKRAKEIGLDDWSNTSFPTVFWDLFGEEGHPIRATVQEMGPLLLSRLLELNETQEGVLNILFRVAADEKLPLLDLN